MGELPEGPDAAAVYEPRGEVTQEQAARLAKALGLTGTPRAGGDAWLLGPAKDGSGPSLRVSRKAPGTWTFTRDTPVSGDNCLKGRPCPPGPKDSDASPAHPDDSGGAVSEAAAKKAAAPVLKALGQDDAKLDATQLMGPVRVVNADPEVGGLPTFGWSTGIQIDAEGRVAGGSGNVLEPRKGATYPVVSAEKALDLKNEQARGDGRVGIGGCATPVPHGKDGSRPEGPAGTDKDDGPVGGDSRSDKGGGTHKGGGTDQGPQARCVPDPQPPKPKPIPVTDATFGLAAQYVSGRQTLVPSWLFEVRPQGARGTFTMTHPAVDPKYLTGPGVPTPRSTVGPGDPGTRTEPVRVEGYSVAGRELVLHFTGGVCGTYAATAEESGRQVAVKVTETVKEGTVCVAMARSYTLTVPLDKPLGDRRVVTDGGRAVPRHDGGTEAVPAPRS
ncbi:hypothetical protein [Streptomyces sp. G45]|uniref:hypothetical protein n=1 Tax=Streptomyces sp. G45 TaxID=3406627 RepID=UPI003C2A7924